MDTPIRDLEEQMRTNGQQSSLAAFVDQNRDRALREVGSVAISGGGRIELLGTPAQVADQMAAVMDEVGGDGFLFTQDVTTRRSIAEITDGLVPELQKRGLTSTDYTYTQLRDKLLDF